MSYNKIEDESSATRNPNTVQTPSRNDAENLIKSAERFLGNKVSTVGL